MPVIFSFGCKVSSDNPDTRIDNETAELHVGVCDHVSTYMCLHVKQTCQLHLQGHAGVEYDFDNAWLHQSLKLVLVLCLL